MADEAKPRFVGDLNSVTFVRNDDIRPERLPVACRGQSRGENSGEATDEEVLNSLLDYSPSLPAGYELVFEQANKCAGQVISIARNYRNDRGSLIVIARVAATPIFDADAPSDRLEPVSQGSRRGALQRSILEESNRYSYTALYLTDEQGKLFISGTGVPASTLLNIAQSID